MRMCKTAGGQGIHIHARHARNEGDRGKRNERNRGRRVEFACHGEERGGREGVPRPRLGKSKSGARGRAGRYP